MLYRKEASALRLINFIQQTVKRVQVRGHKPISFSKFNQLIASIKYFFHLCLHTPKEESDTGILFKLIENKVMKIGIIGIGILTLELARRACAENFEVILNNPRGNSLVSGAIEKIGNNMRLDSLTNAANADIILLFIPKDDLESVIEKMPDMKGKIILHTSSLVFNPRSLLPGISNAPASTITASLLPGAHVIKLFRPVELETSSVCADKFSESIYFSAAHSPSKYIVKAFLKKLGFAPIDLTGRLKIQNGINLPKDSCRSVFHSIKNYYGKI